MRYLVITDKENEDAPYLVVDTRSNQVVDSFFFRFNAEHLKDALNDDESP